MLQLPTNAVLYVDLEVKSTFSLLVNPTLTQLKVVDGFTWFPAGLSG